MAASGESRDLDEASRMLYSLALPAARHTGESLAYTLRHAASIAIAQKEFRAVRFLLDEAAAECLRIGTLHTLDRIRRLQSLLELIAPL